MQEHRVTIGGTTYPLPDPFFVLATQNPIEQEGTYPLPEAQLDRFLFNIRLDYPSFDEEVDIVRRTTVGAMPTPQTVLSADDILQCQAAIRRMPVADNVLEYAVRLVSQTRPIFTSSPQLAIQKYISYGAGPRASQYLVMGAKSHAALAGKYSPDIEDVQAVALNVLRHRIVRNYYAEAEGVSTDDIICSLLRG